MRWENLLEGCFGLLLILVAAGCSADNSKGDAAASPDAHDAIGDSDQSETATCKAFKIVGQPCSDGCECLSGTCTLNEYAPFRFCTRPCEASTPGTPCPPEEGETTWNAFCVKFSSEFKVPPNQFCVPLCETLSDCVKLGAPWETCEPVHWKGNPLYASVPESMCMAASAQGHEPVDPDTCEGWEPLYDEFAEERFACINYCAYLDACKELPSSVPEACCAFHCASEMITNGIVDKDYFQVIRCYIDNYNAFTGSALVCTKPLEMCGTDPHVPD